MLNKIGQPVHRLGFLDPHKLVFAEVLRNSLKIRPLTGRSHSNSKLHTRFDSLVHFFVRNPCPKKKNAAFALLWWQGKKAVKLN